MVIAFFFNFVFAFFFFEKNFFKGFFLDVYRLLGPRNFGRMGVKRVYLWSGLWLLAALSCQVMAGTAPSQVTAFCSMFVA